MMPRSSNELAQAGTSLLSEAWSPQSPVALTHRQKENVLLTLFAKSIPTASW